MYNYLSLGILILTWSLNPFIKKKILDDISVVNFYCLSVISVAILSLFYILFYNLENTKESVLKIARTPKLSLIFIGTILLSIISSFAFHYLIQKNDATYIIPQLQPVVMIFLLLWGYFVFNEKIDKNRAVGIVAVAVGIWFIQYKSN
jgi:drug/metabolite transporter (DMT)-like permease